MQTTKLNIFQRGILQKCATTLVYFASIAIGSVLLDWLDKRLFVRLAEEAQQRGILSPEGLRAFTTLIEARDGTTIFAIILVGLACVVAGWLFMRWSARRNWSWPVTLPKVVEFRWAMEQLGIDDPGERIAFVRKHKLPVFIALSPLIGKEQERVSAKLYAFAHHYSLGDEEIFERHTGKQTLCLDAGDYERLVKEHGQKTDIAYSARIAALKRDLDALTDTNSLYVDKIDELTETNEKLLKENAEFQRKEQTAPGREKKTETSNIRRIPFWRVAGPLINRLIDEAKSDSPYTRSDIQSAFDTEVEKFPALKAAIKKELHAGKQKEPESEFDLTGWGMDSIRAALGDLAQKNPGNTKKH